MKIKCIAAFLNFKNLIDKNVKCKKPISTIYSPNLKPNISNPTKIG